VAFSVLAVCIGNVCRSPVAEGLLRDRLAGTGFRVESAGVRALVGHAMTKESAAELAQRGVHVNGFVARRLQASMPRHADLVLTATTDIRRAALEEAPGALRRTFTWKEFAALVDGRSAETPQALVTDAAARRAEVGHLDLDTDDPIGRPPAVHARVAAEIDEAITTIARALTRSSAQ
jgi:protein-tyrosine phosphatase